MTNTFHKIGLMLILLKLVTFPVVGFSVMHLDDKPAVESKILGFSNTLHNPVVVKEIPLKLNINGTPRQTFYDVVPEKFLENFQYSIEYNRELPVSIRLVKDDEMNKLNLEVTQTGYDLLESSDVSVIIKIVR